MELFERTYKAKGKLTVSKPDKEPGTKDGQLHYRMTVSGKENTDQYFQMILVTNPEGPDPDNSPSPTGYDYTELDGVEVTVTIDVSNAMQSHHAKVP